MPTHDAHPDTRQGMCFEITHPTIHHLGIRIERFDRACVHAPLKVLLRLFVREWATGDGPQRPPRGEGDDARDRDPERRGGVGRKVRGELDGLGEVGAELDERNGDAVRARVSVRLKDAAPVNYGCVPLTLFRVYAYATKRFNRRHFALGSGRGGGLSQW